MKFLKEFFMISFFLTFLSAHLAQADINNINLNWSGSPEANSENFLVYFSFLNGMEDKIIHSICDKPVETVLGEYKMSCTNVPITSYPAYIQIAYIDNQSNTTIFSNIQEIAKDPYEQKTTPIIKQIKIVAK